MYLVEVDGCSEFLMKGQILSVMFSKCNECMLCSQVLNDASIAFAVCGDCFAVRTGDFIFGIGLGEMLPNV